MDLDKTGQANVIWDCALEGKEIIFFLWSYRIWNVNNLSYTLKCFIEGIL